MSVTVYSSMPLASATVRQKTALGLRRAVQDVRKEARPNTPFDTGDLANRGRQQVLGLNGIVAWDVAYAQYQERGARSDGSHRIQSRPSGGKSHFAEDAVKKVASQGKRYFG